MTAKKFSNALGNIGDHYIHEAIAYRSAKKRFWLLGSVAALLLISICAIGTILFPYIGGGNIGGELQAQQPISFFSSFEEFESYQREDQENELTCYYIPANLPDSFTFSEIITRKNTYITVTYLLDPAEIVTEEIDESTKVNMTRLTCTYSVFTIIPASYKEIEYEGQTIHYKRLYRETSSGKILVGYDILFFEGDHRIEMHLPSLDTLENMLQYTEVTRIEIP